MASVLPSPPSSDDHLTTAGFFSHVPAWTTTTMLPGLCRSSHDFGCRPCTPETPDDSSSRDSDSGCSPNHVLKDDGGVLQDACATVTSSSASSPKSAYKHVPHREKPPHLVARRNARERRRVQAVNSAFCRLRKCVPVENRAKRLSKVKTLHRAIEYIQALQHLLTEADKAVTSSTTAPEVCTPSAVYQETPAPVCDKENDASQRWITLENAPVCGTESYSSYLNFYEECGITFAS
uniref:BHLH domain-containing protein n=1 Tax=Rhipicephalus appendiculatus TaxID=34631 RepID=A0A131YWD8_RHIAP